MHSVVKILIIVLSVAALAGCKTLVITGRCSICDKPISTELSANPSQPTQKTPHFSEYRLPTITINRDVDVAFVNVKREFGFWTEAELRADFGSHQSLAEATIGSTAFAYNAIPGVYYNMRKFIVNEGEQFKRPEIRQGHVINAYLEKQSPGKTRITLKYWSQYSAAEIQVYELWIKAKLEKALQLKLF